MNFLRALIAILLVLPAGLVHAQVSPLLQTPYQPPVLKGTVRFYLEDMVQRTRVQISYSDEMVKRRRNIKLSGTERTIEDMLKAILAGTGVTTAERGGKIL